MKLNRYNYKNCITTNKLLLLLLLEFVLITINIDRAHAECDPIDQWDCDNGQCIESEERCDGIVHCEDGSDEIAENCVHINCPSFAFRCAYGACVRGTDKCDGVQNCVDNSDENPIMCTPDSPELLSKLQGNCSDTFMQCGSGECIENEYKCDGVLNCEDGSDETVELCSNTWCPTYAFSCGYGGCINGQNKCDGKDDCHDSSDEAGVLCNKTRRRGTSKPKPIQPITLITTTTTTTTQRPVGPIDNTESCSVPSDRRNLIITDLRNNAIIPGSTKPKNAIINFKCETGYTLKGDKRNVCLGYRGWTNEFPYCTKYCSRDVLYRGYSTEPNCRYGGSFVKCNDRISPGTEATIACATNYIEPSIPTIFNSLLTCKDDGKWEPPEKSHCDMECGIVDANSTPYSKGGQPVNITEVPWHVGIYSRFDDETYVHICGGSIISAYLVISAAHCFWDTPNSKLYNESWYAVGAGKYFRDFNSKDEYFAVQKRNISRFYINNYKDRDQNYLNDIIVLQLDIPLRFTPSIRPVCIKFPNLAGQHIDSNQEGFFAGWGITEGNDASTILQKVNMNTLSYGECKIRLQSQYNLQNDKFCLTNLYGGSACRGDSGGGFFVKDYEYHQNKYFYRLVGVVSHAPIKSQDCGKDGLVAMTNVQYFHNLIEPPQVAIRRKDYEY